MHTLKPVPFQARQQGFVLVVALILLLILTILGLAAAQSTSIQEQMAGNARNHTLAFQSAEAGLAAAQSGILQGLWSNADFSNNADGLYVVATCCAPASGWTSAWTVSNVWTTALPATDAVPGLNVPDVAHQPVFIIERLPPATPPGQNLSNPLYGGGVPQNSGYRITARGWGGDLTSSVVVQGVYVP